MVDGRWPMVELHSPMQSDEKDITDAGICNRLRLYRTAELDHRPSIIEHRPWAIDHQTSNI
jgi:hypothetical protein